MRELERGQLERACRPLLDRLEAPCHKALADAHCTPADIDQVLLVGGMTRMPAVQERAVTIFGKPAQQGRQPRRDRRDGRRRPLRHHGRRAAGGRAARRHAAQHGRAGRRRPDVGRDPGEHQHPDAREEGVRDHRGQPDVRRDRDPPGRARGRVAQPPARPVRARRSARRRRAARPRSRSRSRWTPTASSRSPPPRSGRGRAATVTIEASSGLTADEIRDLGLQVAR